MGRMNHDRRAFLGALLASALVPGEGVAADQVRVIGYLSGGAHPREFLTEPLAKLGWVDGKNLRFEMRTPPRWDPDTLASAARELVSTKPDVLMALMAWRVQALASATRTIPIVSLGTADPVGEGLVESARRPGRNVTGLSLGLREGSEATIRLLRRMKPGLRRVGMLHAVDPRPSFFEHAARAAGVEPVYIRVGDSSEERAVRPLAGEAMFIAPAKDAEAVLMRHAKAAYAFRVAMVGSFPLALLQYGLDFADQMGRAAAIVDKVLRGGDPAEIPLEMPDRTSFRLNRRVARELGIGVPPDVLLRVTEFVD